MNTLRQMVGRIPRPIIAAVVVSRILVVAAALLAEGSGWRVWAMAPSGASGPILTSLTSWDAWWYLSIARTGYHAVPLSGAYHDYAFWPLFPAILRLFAWPAPALLPIIGILVANAAFVVAIVLFFRLTSRLFDERVATWSCVAVALFPFSFVFSMAYPESLFLALSLGACLAAEQGRVKTAALLAAAAALARLPGVLLILSLVWILWYRVDRRRQLAWLGAIPLATITFLAFVARLSGEAQGFSAAESAWGRTGAALAHGARFQPLADAPHLFVYGVFLALLFAAGWLWLDRVPRPYLLLVLLTIAGLLATGSLMSVGRLGMVAFPIYWVAASQRRSRWFLPAYLAVSGVLLPVLAVLVFVNRFTP